MDGLVLLARGLGHHLHAGVQDFLAGHDQARIAAAKQLGEHAAEVFVDGLEGAAQKLAGLAVDGGLYVPDSWPELARGGDGYAGRAAALMQPFVGI